MRVWMSTNQKFTALWVQKTHRTKHRTTIKVSGCHLKLFASVRSLPKRWTVFLQINSDTRRSGCDHEGHNLENATARGMNDHGMYKEISSQKPELKDSERCCLAKISSRCNIWVRHSTGNGIASEHLLWHRWVGDFHSTELSMYWILLTVVFVFLSFTL